MSFESAQVSVQTTATPLWTFSGNRGAPGDMVPILIRVPTGATNVFVGPQSVTVGSGYLLITGSEYTFQIIGGEELFAVAATVQTVYVLQGRY